MNARTVASKYKAVRLSIELDEPVNTGLLNRKAGINYYVAERILADTVIFREVANGFYLPTSFARTWNGSGGHYAVACAELTPISESVESVEPPAIPVVKVSEPKVRESTKQEYYAYKGKDEDLPEEVLEALEVLKPVIIKVAKDNEKFRKTVKVLVGVLIREVKRNEAATK